MTISDSRSNTSAISRRIFLKGAGLTLVGAALAACVPAAAPTSAPAADAPAAPVVLKGATVKFLGGPWAFLPALDTVIDEFANDWAKQNNVTLTFERDAQALPKIQTAIETGGGANIIQYSSPPAIFANALVDVKDIVDELDAEGGGYLPNAPYQMVNEGRDVNELAQAKGANVAGLQVIFSEYGVAIAYSSALVVIMAIGVGLIQLVVGERRLGRRSAAIPLPREASA